MQFVIRLCRDPAIPADPLTTGGFERGVHVQRTAPAVHMQAMDFRGPEIAFGLDVR